MNNVWSEKIQGTKTLYLSRKLRFDDFFAARYKELFGIEQKPGMRILEVGCGPGALAGAFHRWYPEAEITAVDRDTNFINFAKENEPGIEFYEADAVSLPFPDGSFDVTLSHTVCEHVEPSAFWGEQYRVLKPGGLCICLTVVREKSRHAKAPCLHETEEERRFWMEEAKDNGDFEKYGVGKYYVSPEELSKQPLRYGFSTVRSGLITLDLSPENPDLPAGFAERIIQTERESEIEAVLSTRSVKAPGIVPIVNEKYEKRLRLLSDGIKQGDEMTACLIGVVTEK